MAIGLGQMLGFRLPENFDRPYSAVSVTDFWRRWHMTLSRWFRDYVYIPLGGSRGTAAGARTSTSCIVFLLIGLLARRRLDVPDLGRSTTASLLLIERVIGAATGRRRRRALVVLRRAVTLVLVMVGWVFFRADIAAGRAPLPRRDADPERLRARRRVNDAVTNQAIVVGLAASLIFLMPRGFVGREVVAAGRTRLAWAGRVAAVGVLLPLALALVVSGTFSPFLYFRF